MKAQPPSPPKGQDAPPAMHWAHQRERSAVPVVRFMAWLSLALGRRLSRVLVYGIAAYFFLFAPKARAASRAYLQRVLHRPITARDGYRHVLSFASCIHDRVYWLRGRHDLFDVELVGVEHVLPTSDAQADPARSDSPAPGLIFVGAHLGSFEALRMLGETHGLRVRMLMYPDNAQKINAVLAAINPSLQDSVIALGRAESLLTVRDCLQRGECVGALADRQVKQEAGVPFDFLGSTARFPDGPFRMAAMLKTRVVFMAGLYLGGNRYRIEFLPVADFTQTAPAGRTAAIAAAQTQYVRQLEAVCQRAPMNWFNFYDFWHENPH